MLAADQHRAWTCLPIGDLDDIVGPRCPLILAPHPDDESLGCGGLIAACCERARPPVVVFLTDGGMSHPGSKAFPRDVLVRTREREAADAAAILGLPAGRLFFLRQPDAEAPTGGAGFRHVVDAVASLAGRFHCTALLAAWRLDPHCDHAAAALIATDAARRAGIPHLAYPVWGWTLPAGQTIDAGAPVGWRLDIEPYRQRKQLAIAAHATQ